MSSSAITIVGNLTRNPELKFLNSGTPTCKFSVAVNKKGYNDRPDTVSFFECDAFGSIAENIANSVVQGNRVVVYGELVQRSWETEKGEKRSITEIKVEAVGPDLRFATANVIKSESPTRRPAPLLEGEDPF